MRKRIAGFGICLLCLLLVACRGEVTPEIEEPAVLYAEDRSEEVACLEALSDEGEVESIPEQLLEAAQLYDLVLYAPGELDVIYMQGRELSMSVNLTTVDVDSNNIGDHLWFGVVPARDEESLIIEPAEMHRDSETLQAVLREGNLYVGGLPATYMEATFFRADQPEAISYGFRARVRFGEFRYDLVFRAPSLEQYEQYLPVVNALIASIRFESDEDPMERVRLGDITLEIRTRDVRTTVSGRAVQVYCVRHAGRTLRFYARLDDSMPFTEVFFDHTPALDVLLRERTEPAGPVWEWGEGMQTINMLEPREVLREEIELNGTRAIRVVFHDDFRQFDNYVELILFVHNGVLYTLFGQCSLGYEEALEAFLAPILDSVRFADAIVD